MEKLKIINWDGTITEVEPLPMWDPIDPRSSEADLAAETRMIESTKTPRPKSLRGKFYHGRMGKMKFAKHTFEKDVHGFYLTPLIAYSNVKGDKAIWFGWLFWLWGIHFMLPMREPE